MDELKNKRILMFVADLYEDMELLYPKIRLKEAGAHVTVAGEIEGNTYTGKHGHPCNADESFVNIRSNDFDALVIPGGFAPDKLRREKKVLDVTRTFHETGKPIAYICHAGWVPISAGIVKGFKVTSTKAIKDDLVNAGAEWVNEPVVIDRHHITSRNPDDLPHFCNAIIEMMSEVPELERT
ncbi:MAG: type 1 glutamine amidotransferase domain-containing protein [Balneolales bacterium]